MVWGGRRVQDGEHMSEHFVALTVETDDSNDVGLSKEQSPW